MFAVNNGVLTLNGVPVNALSPQQRQNAFGRVGNVNLGSQVYDFSTGSKPNVNFDPRFFEQYEIGLGDSGTTTGYRLRPEYQRLEGMVQVGIPDSVGGYGEVMDPAGIQFDEDFGYLTSVNNIKDPETPRQRMIGNLAMAAWAAPLAYGVALDSGLLGAASNMGSAGFPVGAGPGTGPLLETAGVSTGALDGVGAGALATIPDSLLQNITLPPLDVADPVLASLPDVGGGGYLSNLMSAVRNNPSLLARGLLGGASLINGLTNNGNNSGPPSLQNGSNPGGGNVSVPQLNFTGLLSNYKPMQFDPVPFMSGVYK